MLYIGRPRCARPAWPVAVPGARRGGALAPPFFRHRQPRETALRERDCSGARLRGRIASADRGTAGDSLQSGQAGGADGRDCIHPLRFCAYAGAGQGERASC